MTGRKVVKASSRSIIRNRLAQFAGSDMPHTIAYKEIIDNAIDVINERSSVATATEATIKLSKNRLQVMDNGLGLSTELSSDGENTHMFLSVGVLYTSSNYDGVEESVGANGAGSKIFCLTSHKCSVINFNGRNVRGYNFTNGIVNGYKVKDGKVTDEPNCDSSNFETNEEAINAEPYGDHVSIPYQKQEAIKLFNPPYQSGYMLDGRFKPVGDPEQTVYDDEVDINWLVNYTEKRVGEVSNPKGCEIYLNVYDNDDFIENENTRKFHYSKDKNSDSYVMSWHEQVAECGAEVVKSGDFEIAYCDTKMEVTSIVQGAPIKPRFKTNLSIVIGEYQLSFAVPYSLYYKSTAYPKYTGQDKIDIRIPYTEIGNGFPKATRVYNYFYKLAEKEYLAGIIAQASSGSYYPALDEEGVEIIFAEGASAITATKSKRNPHKQACMGLRGKFLNVWNLSKVKAMNSDVVKQILNVLNSINFERIVIATDADPDGYHITMLILGVIYRFRPDLLEAGKVYYVHTPYYIFDKRGEPIQWSDNKEDCPRGYHLKICKGLGSLKPDEIEKFVINPETRDLWQFELDDMAEESLDLALSYGGKEWIVGGDI